MKIMAIDASTKSTGVAVFNDTKLEYYDCYTASSTDLIKRIQKIVPKIQQAIEEYGVEKIILEEVRIEANMQITKTLKALMWLQAAIAFMIHDSFPKVTIEYVYPSSWRSACGIKTGRGVKRDSLKQADIDFVKHTYGLEVNDDIADAIGIGYSQIQENNRIEF